MRPAGVKPLRITENKGLVTNVDTASLKEEFALRSRGFRHFRSGMIAERDYGTIHRMASYPSSLTMVNGYTLYDPTTDTEHQVIVGVDQGGYGRTQIYVYDGEWIKLTRAIDAEINSFGANGWVFIEVITEEGVPIAQLTDGAVTGWIAYNSTRGTAELVINSNEGGQNGSTGAFQIKTDPSEMQPAWAQGDGIGLYQFYGRFSEREWQHGTVFGPNPHVRFSPVEAQRKVNVLVGSDATPPVMGIPLRVEKQASRTRFHYTPNAGYMTLPAGWYLERALNFDTNFTRFSSPPTSLECTGVPTGDSSIVTPWLEIAHTRQRGGDNIDGARLYQWFMITVMHGYQESDPVYEVCFHANEFTALSVNWNFYVNPGRMPKTVTGLRVYMHNMWFDGQDEGAMQAAIKLASEADLRLVKEVRFDEFDTTPAPYNVIWTRVEDHRYGMSMYGTWFYYSLVAEWQGESLVATLGHYPDYNRSLLKPRFIARAGRGQGAIHVVDADDWTLRISAYNGFGVHADDAFADVEVDRNNFKQRVNLMSRGRLLGVGVANAKIYGIKTNEIEVFDPVTAEQDFFPCDAVASRGIVMFPGGVAYCGASGIFLIPNQGIGVGKSYDYKTQPGGANIAQPILNWYNGALLMANGQPYVTDEFRRGIVAGYDDYYRELWFVIEANAEAGGTEYICARFNVDSGIWGFRVINMPSRPLWFGSAADKTFTIGFASGMLKYPNMQGLNFEDAVTYAGASTGRPFESSMVLNLGILNDLAADSALYGIILEYVGNSTDHAGRIQWNLYRDGNLARVVDSGSLRLDGKEGMLLVDAETGVWNNAQLEIKIPASVNNQRFDLSSLLVGVTQHERKGFE